MARHPLILPLLTESDLADIGSAIDGLVCEIFKISARQAVLALERRMTAALTAAWRAAVEEGLTKQVATLVKGPYSTSRINAFLRRLGLKLSKPLTATQQKVVESRLRSINRLSKQEAVRQAKGKFVFGAVDERAVAATARQQQFWINGFYSDQLSARIGAVSRDVLIEQGLGHREAGRVLMRALRKDLGVAPGVAPSEFAPAVPARYAGNPEYYFQQVASVSGHQSRVFGRMRGFKDAGVITFELVNPMDERTGQVCFAPGVPILMGDGSTRAIEDVRAGDTVITGNGHLRKVKATTQRRAHDWVLLDSYGGRLMITPNHAIMTSEGWKPAGEVTGATRCQVRQLRRADTRPCWDPAGADYTQSGWAHVAVVGRSALDFPAHNLEIDGDDPTYVAAGVVVHNCQEMHGQVFSVDVGIDRLNDIVGSRTPEAVKLAAPWLSGKILNDALAGTRKGSAEATSRLQGLNVVLPPFHPLCRTEPVIVS